MSINWVSSSVNGSLWAIIRRFTRMNVTMSRC